MDKNFLGTSNKPVLLTKGNIGEVLENVVEIQRKELVDCINISINQGYSFIEDWIK